MANPIPLTTDGSGPAGAIPVEIHGASNVTAGEVPDPPAVGQFFLHSNDGVMTWISDTDLFDIINN